jgi:hypothetical protein
MQIKHYERDSFAIADVRGAVLVKANQSAPLPGRPSADYADGLIAQTGKYDDSPQSPGKVGVDSDKLIRPINGGRRLLPADERRPRL